MSDFDELYDWVSKINQAVTALQRRVKHLELVTKALVTEADLDTDELDELELRSKQLELRGQSGQREDL